MNNTNNAEFDLYVCKKMQSKAQNAKERGVEFNLSFQAMKNILRAKHCYYTGVLLTKPRQGKPLRASDITIERVDPSLGYVIGNCVAACYAANNIKSQLESAGLTGLKAGRNLFNKAIKRIEGKKK